MELDAVERQLPVTHRHHLAVGCGRRDLEHVGHRRRGERVVAAGQEVLGSPAKMPRPSWRDGRRLAVHELARLADFAAEDLDDRLVAEADAERRDPDGQPPQDLAGSRLPPRVVRAPVRTTRWEGESCSASSGEISSLRRTSNVRAELAEQVGEVVGERVVVVDRARSSRLPPPASSAASSAASLFRHSWCSAAGSESATMPPPACRYACPSRRRRCGSRCTCRARRPGRGSRRRRRRCRGGSPRARR